MPKENFRVAPKLKEAIVVVLAKDTSESLCQAIPCVPSSYRFAKQELNFSERICSTAVLAEQVLCPTVKNHERHQNIYIDNAHLHTKQLYEVL